jgi:hypothetical protein
VNVVLALQLLPVLALAVMVCAVMFDDDGDE